MMTITGFRPFKSPRTQGSSSGDLKKIMQTRVAFPPKTAGLIICKDELMTRLDSLNM